MPEQQTGRDAAAVIGDALNSAYDPCPEYPDVEQGRHHDKHIWSGACWLCRGDIPQLSTHLAGALAAAGLLASTPDTPPARGDVYVYLTPDGLSDKTTAFGAQVNVDQDDDGPVGVEVLGAVRVTIDGRTVMGAPVVQDDVVDAAAEALREVTIDLGPNTVEAIGRGQRRIHLSGGERRAIAMTATLAAFESRRWRQMARELHDARERLARIEVTDV